MSEKLDRVLYVRVSAQDLARLDRYASKSTGDGNAVSRSDIVREMIRRKRKARK